MRVYVYSSDICCSVEKETHQGHVQCEEPCMLRHSEASSGNLMSRDPGTGLLRAASFHGLKACETSNYVHLAAPTEQCSNRPRSDVDRSLVEYINSRWSLQRTH